MDKPILEAINSPEDLKKLPSSALPSLAQEIRERIISVVHANGGHLASNLGVVELTIALHRVFQSPTDQLIWDVGHQCYTHKLLTGRREQFHTIRKKGGISGFPKRSESDHDIMETGHSSTSISAALGSLMARRIQGDTLGKVISIIGDGALTGGMAFEGLNHAGHLGKDLIVIYNDNNWSISPNVGGLSLNSNLSKLSAYVSRLTATPFYQSIRDKIDLGIQGIPVLGYKMYNLVVRLKKAMKAVFLKETLFSELGFEYLGPVDGHSIRRLTDLFQAAKKIQKPLLIHVVTQKGRGYSLAEGDPTAYHGVSPVTNVDGKIERKSALSWTEAVSAALIDLAEKDKKIVAVTAAMAEGTGLAAFRRRFPKRFFDVGISEQHGVTFAAGLTLSGLKPVVSIYSTFMQRAVDQVIHDVALPQLPVLFLLDRSGLVSSDGETHQGAYDIALFRSVPGLSILAPGFREEIPGMLSWAMQISSPCMIRFPKEACPAAPPDIEPFSKPFQPGKGVFLRSGRGAVLIASLGALSLKALGAAEILDREKIGVDILHLNTVKPFDEEHFLSLTHPYQTIIMVEDGTKQGGLGELIASLLQKIPDSPEFRHLGIPDRLLTQADREELLSMCGLDSEGIADLVRATLVPSAPERVVTGELSLSPSRSINPTESRLS
jgi:1-deoxy-D-xylulose-5-phosphate synthase